MVFRIKLVREIDICLTVQQIAQIDAAPLQMHRIDLEIAPVESAIGIIVINLTFTLWIFRPLYGQSDAASAAELLAGILLVGVKWMHLVQARLMGAFGSRPARDHQRRLQVQDNGRLQAERIFVVNSQGGIESKRTGRDRYYSDPNAQPARAESMRNWNTGRHTRMIPSGSGRPATTVNLNGRLETNESHPVVSVSNPTSRIQHSRR
jgi:hypothetical protein